MREKIMEKQKYTTKGQEKQKITGGGKTQSIDIES